MARWLSQHQHESFRWRSATSSSERIGDLLSQALTLLLSDSRLPSGAHVHSGGVEQAVDDGVIRDVTTLEDYLDGRLLTSGRLFAHVAARACVLAGSRDRSGDIAH